MRLFQVSNNAIEVPGFRPQQLPENELEAVRRLISYRYDPDRACYFVTRRVPHLVGRVAAGEYVFSVTPDIEPAMFVDFLLYANGTDLSRFRENTSSAIDARAEQGHDDFLELLAYLFVLLVERLSKTYLARNYVPRTELLRTIKGRVDWKANFGQHPSAGIVCNYRVIDHDNLLNRLVLSGIDAAARILSGRPDPRVNRLSFLWRSICRPTYPTLGSFDIATRKLTRLTEHYRPALAVARNLLFGFSVIDPFAGQVSQLQSMQFDIALIFERFLSRLLRERFEGTGLEVRAQEDDGRALLDGNGHTYRTVRPDLLLLYAGTPVAVLDAKYKPQYVTTDAGALANSGKLSSEDIYQMFFYAHRALARGATQPLRVAVVAPVLNAGQVVPPDSQRVVQWRRQGESPISIVVVPIQLTDVLIKLRAGLSASDALLAAPSLAALCDELIQSAQRPHIVVNGPQNYRAAGV